MPRLCLLGLGRGDCYCCTLRAVPGDSVSELAWLQGHCHSKQVVLRLPTCALPWGAASSELNPRHGTKLLLMNSYTQSTGAAVQGEIPGCASLPRQGFLLAARAKPPSTTPRAQEVLPWPITQSRDGSNTTGCSKMSLTHKTPTAPLLPVPCRE